jgi:hypothetical protein
MAGFDEQNSFFKRFFGSCNQLVQYTCTLLNEQEGKDQKCSSLDIPDATDPALNKVMETMRQVTESTGCYAWAEARANIIEPMLGYCLRQLEIEMQPGTGMGHGLIGVFRIKK